MPMVTASEKERLQTFFGDWRDWIKCPSCGGKGGQLLPVGLTKMCQVCQGSGRTKKIARDGSVHS